MTTKMAVGFGVGLLLGLFAGTVFALLFAPAKGEELRGQLGEQWTTQREKLAGLGQSAGPEADPVPEG